MKYPIKVDYHHQNISYISLFIIYSPKEDIVLGDLLKITSKILSANLFHISQINSSS